MSQVGDGGERPAINILGELVALGPLRRDTLPRYQHWMNDAEAMRGYDMPRPLTAEWLDRWYERVTVVDKHALFTLYERSSMTAIGHTGLLDINRGHRHGMFDIFIGDPDARGKGYGSEATKLVLDYAFNGIGLQSVYLEVLEYNEPGIRAYTKAGFREIGRLRQHWFMGGRFWDLVYMDCVADEFVGLQVRVVRFAPAAGPHA